MKPLPLLPSLALLAVLVAGPARADSSPAPGAWTSDALLALKSVSDPQPSPDGRWVAYVVSELGADSSDYQTDVWLAPVAGGAALRLTASPQADEFPRWSPDGRTLAFLSERPRPGAKSEAGDEGKRQIWTIRPEGGEAAPLSDAKGGVSAFEWSRDGKLIAYLSREPKTEARRKAEKEKNDAWTPSEMYPWNRLWVMEVETRAATQLTREGHVSGFSIAPDGSKIAISLAPTPLIPDQFETDLYLVPVAGGAPAPLVKRRGEELSPAWSPDGSRIAFVSADGLDIEWYTNNGVCVVPAAGGTPVHLTKSFDERVEGIGSGGLCWTPDSRGLLFFAAQGAASRLFRVDAGGGPVRPLTSGAEVCGAPRPDAAGTGIAYLREDPVTPREVWWLPAAGGGPKPLTDTNPQARALPSFPKELVSWKGADGLTIEGLLIRPAGGAGTGAAPFILNVHGGPAGINTYSCTVASRLYPWALFAQRGWAILLPNPRGSGGYGAKFRAANVRDWGGKDYVDLMNGVDEMVKRGIADPNRLAVCGWSYGGFMTSTIVTKTDRFRAAVVGAGVTDLASFTGTADIPEFARSYFSSWPWEDPKVYVDHSAVFHAGRVKTPTALVHGLADDRVPPTQGWEFYNALRQVGVPTDMLLLPRSPHGPREPRILKAVQRWHLDWFERYVMGSPGGDPKAEAR